VPPLPLLCLAFFSVFRSFIFFRLCLFRHSVSLSLSVFRCRFLSSATHSLSLAFCIAPLSLALAFCLPPRSRFLSSATRSRFLSSACPSLLSVFRHSLWFARPSLYVLSLSVWSRALGISLSLCLSLSVFVFRSQYLSFALVCLTVTVMSCSLSLHAFFIALGFVLSFILFSLSVLVSLSLFLVPNFAWLIFNKQALLTSLPQSFPAHLFYLSTHLHVKNVLLCVHDMSLVGPGNNCRRDLAMYSNRGKPIVEISQWNRNGANRRASVAKSDGQEAPCQIALD
jgi:hypothetical protein